MNNTDQQTQQTPNPPHGTKIGTKTGTKTTEEPHSPNGFMDSSLQMWPETLPQALARMQSIIVRKLAAHPDEDTPRWWFADRGFETHFFNALSTTFPEGERFFIQAVRAYAGQLPASAEVDGLRQQVSAFVGQEGQHSRVHDAHVDILVAQGFTGVVPMNNVMRSVLRFFLRKTPRYALAVTMATEHVTAVLADALLTHPERWLEPMSDDMQLLWHWHAIEESEHKAVAFDVYNATGAGNTLRILAMLQIASGLFLEIAARHCYLLAKDGLLFNPTEWRRGLRFVWGREGIMRTVMRGLPQYLRRDFHPWDHDNRKVISEFAQRYQHAYTTAATP